jgi:hypothetical protein
MMMTSSDGPIHDAKVDAVVARLEASRRRAPGGGPRCDRTADRDPHAYVDYGFSIHPEQGELIYVLCRALGARRSLPPRSACPRSISPPRCATTAAAR